MSASESAPRLLAANSQFTACEFFVLSLTFSFLFLVIFNSYVHQFRLLITLRSLVRIQFKGPILKNE